MAINVKPAEAWAESHSGASQDAYEIVTGVVDAINATVEQPGEGALVEVAPQRITSSVNIAAGAVLIILENVGTDTATVATVNLLPGERMSFAAPPGFAFGAVAVVGSATAIVLASVTVFG